MKPIDLSLYLVLDPDLCGSIEGMVATARAAVEGGVSVVQLRAPKWKKKRWYDAARQLKTVLSDFGVPLIINDQVDIALAVDADGVHVGQEDMPVDVVRQLIGPDKILGLSVSNSDQLVAVSGCVDYIGVGPVFPTSTKPDAAPALGVAGLAEIVRLAHVPTVAIGGISSSNLFEVMNAGVNGVAVVSAICQQHNPREAAVVLRNLLNEVSG